MNANKTSTLALLRRVGARQDIWVIILLAIMLLAFGLRMAQVANLRMWGDEGFSVYSANRDLYAITFEGKDVDPHPPLYYYLLHYWLPLGGYSELAIRFFSVVFGTATVALIYAIGKKMFDARTGASAALIAALAPFAVHYSQEVRMYALVMFFGALALYFFVQLVHRSAFSKVRISPRLWLGFFISMFLAQYSLYQTAFVFVAQGIFLAPFLKQRFKFIVQWLAVSLAIVILFIPWLLAHSGSAITDVQGVAGDTVPMNALEFLARGFYAIAVGTTIPLTTAFTLSALVLAVIGLGLFVALITRAARVNDWLLVAFVVVPMASLYPIYWIAPLYRGRLFALALVPLMILIARASVVMTQRARWTAIPIALLIVGASLYSLNDYYFRYDRYAPTVEDYIPAIQAIEQQAQPGDVVLFHAYWQEGYFLSHYHGPPLTYGAVEKQSDLDYALNQPRTVWVIVQALARHDVENWLAQRAFPLGEQKYGQMRVLRYRTGTPARGENVTPPIQFDNGMQLLGYHFNDAPIESGRGAIMVQLDWLAARAISDDYALSVRLTDASGNVIWAQGDNPPASGTLPTSTWQPGQRIADYHAFTLPAGTPPGEYTLRLVAYASNSGVAANIVAPDNARGQMLALGNVTVVKPSQRVAAPKIANPLDVRWNEIALVGVDRGADEINAGDVLPLTLYWRATQTPTRDYIANVFLIDAQGGRSAFAAFRPAHGALDADGIWLDKVQLTVDAGVPAGEATVLVYVTDAKSDERLPVQTSAPIRDLQFNGNGTSQSLNVHAVEIGRVKINARSHRFDLPAPKFSVTATLDSKIKLLGYDLEVKPGAPLALTLYWQALDGLANRYTVFAHLLDAQGNLVAQRDSEPDAGHAPTTSWVPNEIITDHYQIDLPDHVAPGDYTLAVGMYNAPTGARLRVNETGADQMILTKITLGAK